MKVTYVKPTFYKEGDKISLMFEVDAADVSQILALKRGESYEIAPYSQEVAGDSQSPTEKLETAQRLISEALIEMEYGINPELPLEVKKCCGTCAAWIEQETIPVEGDSSGHCRQIQTETESQYGGDCAFWKEG